MYEATAIRPGVLRMEGQCLGICPIRSTRESQDFIVIDSTHGTPPTSKVSLVSYCDTEDVVSAVDHRLIYQPVHSFGLLHVDVGTHLMVLALPKREYCHSNVAFDVGIFEVSNLVEQPSTTQNRNITAAANIGNTFVDVKKISVASMVLSKNQKRFAVLGSSSVQICSLESGFTFTTSCIKATNTNSTFYAGEFSPHHENIFIAAGDGISVGDLRNSTFSPSSTESFIDVIRDVSFNPNRIYLLMTSDEMGNAKLWDIRKLEAPQHTYRNLHSHWVNFVRFNQYHDELLLTGSTDFGVKLWNLSKTESQVGSSNDMVLEDFIRSKTDSHIALVDEHTTHENNISGLEWGMYDPWIYASCSVDGRVIVCSVPQGEKYKILL